MKTRIPNLGLALFALTVLTFAGVHSVVAQGTAFTYNGRLNNNGAPVNGAHDLRFTLYDASAAGNLIAGPLTFSHVEVTNGLFMARIDFGTSVFTGPARWLNIEVQPAGGGGFTLLNPRQEVTSSPYAIRAASAGTAADVSAGSVVQSLNSLRDNVTLAPGANVTITPNGNTLTLAAAGAGGSGIWSVLNNNAYYNAGNVGIGTTTPAHRLSLAGGPSWTANLWSGALELGYGSAIGWQADPGGQRFGIGEATGGLYVFHTASDPGTTGSPTIFDFEITDAGNAIIYGDETLNGDLFLGSRTRQMFNLFGTGFGIGVQTANLYYRSGAGFAWHVGGAHNDATYNSGGGTTVATLDLTTGLDFGSRLGQHLSLWGGISSRRFAIGIQAGTLYSRCGGTPGDAFAWYKGGIHDDNSRNAGGGQTLMTLDGENGLFVSGPASVCALTIRGGCDLAEPFPMNEEEIEKGSVVVIDDEHPGQLKLSTQAYDIRVAGIVSGANGVNTGIALLQEGTMKGGQNVALSGRVYVQADAMFGPIKPGDLLTTSDTPGHAMKVADHARAQGAILGKAMSSLNEGKGMVLVLVTLQ